MLIAIVGLLLAAIGLIVSLGFNYLQYRWRKEERDERAKERLAINTEQQRRERLAPEIYNSGGAPAPIVVSGSRHSEQGPYMDLWAIVTVVNPTLSHMKIGYGWLRLDGAAWEIERLAFHLKTNPRERYERISMSGGSKQDYELHFLFPEGKFPKGLSGELWLTSSNREDEPFPVSVRFA
jgi:hypothetical protein